jgi:SAM-dependent methyltransferase
VQPEVLDDLPPDDPRARRARRDLRRVHRAMGSVTVLRRAITRLRLVTPPRRILELGAGDGTLLLRLAGALAPPWSGVELTLLDRHDLLDSPTREAYRRLDWSVGVDCTDVLAWAASPPAARYDLCVANLFLHHFEAAALARLLAAAAARCDALVACEPQRDALARLGSRLVGLIGANAVTREDAVKSVDAGFAGRELTAAWPPGDWRLDEYRALPFTHCFTAVRAAHAH